MKEIWKIIPNFPEYKASNLGKIMSNVGHCRKIGYILKQNLNTWGYPHVYLRDAFGSGKTIRTMNAVMLAFVGEKPYDKEINHKDGDKTNSELTNLEYVTKSENVKHAYRLGLINHFKGEESPNAKLKEIEVRRIYNLFHKNIKSVNELMKIFNCGKRTVYDVINRRTWKHIWES